MPTRARAYTRVRSEFTMNMYVSSYSYSNFRVMALIGVAIGRQAIHAVTFTRRRTGNHLPAHCQLATLQCNWANDQTHNRLDRQEAMCKNNTSGTARRGAHDKSGLSGQRTEKRAQKPSRRQDHEYQGPRKLVSRAELACLSMRLLVAF